MTSIAGNFTIDFDYVAQNDTARSPTCCRNRRRLACLAGVRRDGGSPLAEERQQTGQRADQRPGRTSDPAVDRLG
jgi:hypothetical protein